MKFGVDVPTCLAGMAYPVPFAAADGVVRIAVEAEQLGYHEVAGNDHLSTQRFVRDAWQSPPDYFEPLMMLATIAAKTSVVRLGTGILVLPMRDPVLLAKQVATLDHVSGGRVNLAVAAGGYRDEFESVVPDLAAANRNDLMVEGIESLRVLFEQPRSSYDGKYRRFVDVESYPKPVQSPLPIFSGGNGKSAIRRAGERCEGWLPGQARPRGDSGGPGKSHRACAGSGPRPGSDNHCPAIGCLHRRLRYSGAREKFERSTFELFRGSLKNTMMKGVDEDKYIADNLIGTPDEVCAKVAAFEDAGLDAFYATLFVADTVEEMLDQMRLFARYVLPAFPQRVASVG